MKAKIIMSISKRVFRRVMSKALFGSVLAFQFAEYVVVIGLLLRRWHKEMRRLKKIAEKKLAEKQGGGHK